MTGHVAGHSRLAAIGCASPSASFNRVEVEISVERGCEGCWILSLGRIQQGLFDESSNFSLAQLDVDAKQPLPAPLAMTAHPLGRGGKTRHRFEFSQSWSPSRPGGSSPYATSALRASPRQRLPKRIRQSIGSKCTRLPSGRFSASEPATSASHPARCWFASAPENLCGSKLPRAGVCQSNALIRLSRRGPF